jgi:hypothetical protein
MSRSLALAALLAGCSQGPDRLYEKNDLQLLTRYAAKELCSCLFVMERDEIYCREWTRQAPNLRTYRIDWSEKRVETQAVLDFGARALRLGAPRLRARFGVAPPRFQQSGQPGPGAHHPFSSLPPQHE